MDLRSLGPETPPGVSLGVKLLPSGPRDRVPRFHPGSLCARGGTVGGTCIWAFVWGGVPPAYPDPGGKVWLHFLPFPQEGTHTPLNLTPKAAASRPGAAHRPNWLLPPHAGTRLLGGGVVVLVGGRWLRRLLLGSRILAPRVPGIQAIGQPLTLLREASRPAGARGGSFVLGLLPAFSTRAPPAAPGEEGGLVDQAWAGVPGEGRAGLQEGTERLRRRPGSALQGTAEGESGPPSPPPFSRPRAPSSPLPRAPGGGSPACICRRGGSGRRLA